MPRIFENKGHNSSVRIWVIGCGATGKEAYSLAMFCAERISGVLDAPKIQIFATDIDETALAVAREGGFTPSMMLLMFRPNGCIDFLARKETNIASAARLEKWWY